jgi:hypothetical protein
MDLGFRVYAVVHTEWPISENDIHLCEFCK